MSLKVGMIKSEIEKEIAGKGTFVQIDWLTRFLKEPLTMEMKKFTSQKLAEIYEKTSMFKEAAKMYDNMAGLSITFAEKIKHHMKAVETYAKGGDATGADESMRRAMAEANSVQKEEIYQQTLRVYKVQAEIFETTGKRGNALQIYEKLVEMRITPSEREAMKEKMKDMYEKLGRRKELHNLERAQISSSRPELKIPQRQPLPGALRDPRDMGAVRSRQPMQSSKENSKPASKEDFDVDDLFK
jgi:tetratricopeptide (TPR) repeat protein